MKTFLAISALAFLAISYTTEASCPNCNNPPDNITWECWKVCFSKTYTNLIEELRRKAIYLQNYARVQAHNLQYYAGKVSDRQEMNKFSDITPQEFRLRNGCRPPANRDVDDSGDLNVRSKVNREGRDLPASFDWRTKDGGKVSPVKDQGVCASCWSFAAIAATESQVLLNTSLVFVPLSEQEIVSCDKTHAPNNGCSKGYYGSAWQYMLDTNGIVSAADYPYTSANNVTGECLLTPASTWAVRIIQYIDVLRNDTAQLMNDLAVNGPIAATLNGDDLQAYRDGIHSCAVAKPTHAVLVVGWDSDQNGKPYWIVKNSYGTNWGQLQGFFYLARGDAAGDCGITQYPAYPRLRGEPS